MILSQLNHNQRLVNKLINKKQWIKLHKVCLQTNLHQNHQFRLKHPQPIFLQIIVVKTKHLQMLPLISQIKPHYLVIQPTHFCLEVTRLIILKLKKQKISQHSFSVILHHKHRCLEGHQSKHHCLVDYQHKVCLIQIQLLHHKHLCSDNLAQGLFLELQVVFSVLHHLQLRSLVSQQEPLHFSAFRKIISQVYLISQLCLIRKSLRMMMMKMMMQQKQIKKHLFMLKVAMIKLCLNKGFRLKNHLTLKCLM